MKARRISTALASSALLLALINHAQNGVAAGNPFNDTTQSRARANKRQPAPRPQVDPSREQLKAMGNVPGPDVTVSRVGLDTFGSGDDFRYYGTADGIRAFSVAFTACNIGTEPAEWIPGSSGRHPVTGQDMYRLLDGRFEQIGMSWPMHNPCAPSEPTCGICQPTACSTLGIGCAATEWALLSDGSQGGPRAQINPQGQLPEGTHTDPHPLPEGPSAIHGRLQISDADILTGGIFIAEIQIVTHDEPLENRRNNASWRQVVVTLTESTGDPPGGGQESVHQGEPAIFAWQFHDPEVQIANVDVPGEGRFHLGYRVTDNGDGTWHYEYALHNLNSHRAAGSFSVPVAPGTKLSNIGFHDIDYHSGDGVGGVNQSDADWEVTLDAALTWATETFDENDNANALRWSTLYNFRFDADARPGHAEATIGLFRPGEPDSVTAIVAVPICPPGCAADFDCDGTVDAADLAELLAAWGPDPGHEVDFNGDGVVDAADLAELLSGWGLCP